MSLKINLRNKSYWLLKTMSATIKGAFYVPHHKKPYRKTEGWDCQHCVEGEHWSWQKVHSSDLDEINTRIRNEENKMRCRGCGSRRPGYSVLGFGLQSPDSVCWHLMHWTLDIFLRGRWTFFLF